MTKIKLINHSGLLISGEDVNLLMDPWLEGSAFNDGWDLLSPSAVIDYSDLTHVWISHEHPDHFSIIEIKKIIKINSKVCFLFQKTKDKRVRNFIEKIGGKLIELSDNELFFFSKKDFIRVIKCGSMDSLAIVHLGGKTIINMNDCVTGNEIEKLHSAISSLQIDALFTQFGYAAFISNIEETTLRRNAAIKKLNQMAEQIDFFKPKFTIPFASFIYFSHKENFYMNDLQTDLREVEDAISKTSSLPIILYPGDTFSFQPNNNSLSVNKYLDDRKKIKPKRTSKLIKFEILHLKAQDYLKRMQAYHGKRAILFLQLISPIYKLIGKNPFNEVNLYITDLKINVNFNLSNGLKVNNNLIEPDIFLGSQSLEYILDYDWGIASLNVNGRMQVKDEFSKLKFRRVFQMGTLKNNGVSISKNPLKIIFNNNKKIGQIKTLKSFSNNT
jgi:UDP-MurNAc hydroxylase